MFSGFLAGAARGAIIRLHALLCTGCSAVTWLQHACRSSRWYTGPQVWRPALAPAQQIERLRERVKIFEKLPAHVALVVDCDEEHGGGAAGPVQGWVHEQLASVICWCAALEINVVTLYDADGCLAGSVVGVELAVARRQQCLADSLPHFELLTYVPHHECESPHEDAASRRKLVLTVLSAQHGGAEGVAAAARHLASAAVAAPGGGGDGDGGAAVSSDSSAEERVSEQTALGGAISTLGHLRGSPAPEPDLLLRFTPPHGTGVALLTTDGFSPWHLRVSEIYQQGSLADFEWPDFLMALHKYNLASLAIMCAVICDSIMGIALRTLCEYRSTACLGAGTRGVSSALDTERHERWQQRRLATQMQGADKMRSPPRTLSTLCLVN